MGEHRELVATAIDAAEAGAEVLRRLYRSPDLDVRSKAANDFVTRADKESEERILELILGRHPDHSILAEESGAQQGASSDGFSSGFEWIVDPLDGTKNFLQGLPVFCVSIGCRYRGEMVAAAVVDPLRRDVFSAGRGDGAFLNERKMLVSTRPDLSDAFLATGFPFRVREHLDTYLGIFGEVFGLCSGVRRAGSAALDLAYTAAGVFDGFFEFRLAPWDLAAGALLIEEAGGVITDFAGQDRYLEVGDVIAGPSGIHADLLRRIGAHLAQADSA